MTVSRAQVARLETFSADVIADMIERLSGVQASLLGSPPDVVRDALLEVAPALSEQYGQLIATGAAEWYEEVRAAELGGRYGARLGATPPRVAIERNVRWAADALYKDDPLTAFAAIGTSLERHIRGTSRGTVTLNTDTDPRAVGWQRIARPAGCKFCVMLSQRGAVYMKASVDFASHDDCHCRAAPSWDPSAPEVDVRAYEASRRTVNMSDRQKARHNEMTRAWMDDNESELDAFRAELEDR